MSKLFLKFGLNVRFLQLIFILREEKFLIFIILGGYRTIAINQIVDLTAGTSKKTKKGEKQDVYIPNPMDCKLPPVSIVFFPFSTFILKQVTFFGTSTLLSFVY